MSRLFLASLCCSLAVAACGSAAPAGPSVPGTVQVGRLAEKFDSPIPSDPAQAAVIESFREAWVLWDQSSEDQRLTAPVTVYVTGKALTSNLDAVISSEKRQDILPSGADRFFKTTVTALAASTATVSTCDDASKFHVIYKRTGQIDPAYEVTSPSQQYLFEIFTMIRHAGHWAMSAVTVVQSPDHRADRCQP